MTPRSRNLTWLWPLLRPRRGAIVVGSAAVAVQSGVALAAPFLFGLAIDHGVVPGHLTVITELAAAYLALAGLGMLAARVEVRTAGLVEQHTLHAVRGTLFAHLLKLPVSFFRHEGSGGVVARMTGDVDSLGGRVSGGFLGLASDIATCAGVAVILVLLDWRLALATLSVGPVLAAAMWRYQRRSGAAWRDLRAVSSRTTVALHETITGALEIQAYRAEPAALSRAGAASQNASRAYRRTVLPAALFFPGVELAAALATVVVLVFGGHLLLAGQLRLGTLTAFLLYLALLFGPVFDLSEFYDTVLAAKAGATRIGMVLATEPAVRDPQEPATLSSPGGHIEMEDVCFAYPGPDGTPGPEVLHGISLAIAAGTTLGLVGATGAGKSTIASLILRLHDPSAGRVALDGTDLRRLRLADLRDAVSFVPQEGFLFAGTVADNIALGSPRASREQVEAAVTALEAWPVINGLASGLDTDVGERGRRLAAGERQMISLIRAWLADPVVLVLDEATSHLDAATELRVSRALRQLRAGRTTVIIAHRLAGVMAADQIAVIADGAIAETGSPAELLSAGGQFADFYQRWARAAGVTSTITPDITNNRDGDSDD